MEISWNFVSPEEWEPWFMGVTFKYVDNWSFASDFQLNECKGKPVGYVRPHPADCSKFIMCIGDGVQRVQVCPAGLHYNVKYDICDHPYLVGCKISNNADEKPSSHMTIPRNPLPHRKPGIVFPLSFVKFLSAMYYRNYTLSRYIDWWFCHNLNVYNCTLSNKIVLSFSKISQGFNKL